MNRVLTELSAQLNFVELFGAFTDSFFSWFHLGFMLMDQEELL